MSTPAAVSASEKPAPSAPTSKPAPVPAASRGPPTLLLLLVFPAISCLAWSLMMYPITHPSPLATLTLRTYCPAGAPPAAFSLLPAFLGRWATTTNDTLCLLTTFFELVLRSPWPAISPGTAPGGGGREMLWDLLVSVLPPLGIMYLESERPGASIWVRYPLVWGLAYQNLGAGIVCPLYYLLLLLTSAPRTAIPSHRAEAAVMGVALGFALPSLAMVLIPDYRITVLWQFFPLLITAARAGWATVRPEQAQDPGYGDFWGRMMHGAGLVLSTLVHVYALLEAAPLDAGYESMWRAYARSFLPVLPLPEPTAEPEAHLWHALANFLKWDWIFIVVTTFLAGLFAIAQTRTVRAAKELKDVGTWALMVGAFILMGPGALVAGIWMWRDDILWEEREGKKV